MVWTLITYENHRISLVHENEVDPDIFTEITQEITRKELQEREWEEKKTDHRREINIAKQFILSCFIIICHELGQFVFLFRPHMEVFGVIFVFFYVILVYRILFFLIMVHD